MLLFNQRILWDVTNWLLLAHVEFLSVFICLFLHQLHSLTIFLFIDLFFLLLFFIIMKASIWNCIAKGAVSTDNAPFFYLPNKTHLHILFFSCSFFSLIVSCTQQALLTTSFSSTPLPFKKHPHSPPPTKKQVLILSSEAPTKTFSGFKSAPDLR